MRSRLWLVAVLVPLMSCGSNNDSGADRADLEAQASEEAAAEEAEEEAEQAAAEEAERQAQRRRYRTCADVTEDLSTALSEVNSRLSVGLTNDEYGNFVGDAQVEYDRLIDDIEAGGVPGPCIDKVAIPLENALNDHIRVFNDWGDCIQDYSCDFNTGQVNDDAQSGWVRASERTDNSDRALEAMRP